MGGVICDSLLPGLIVNDIAYNLLIVAILLVDDSGLAEITYIEATLNHNITNINDLSKR